MRPATYTTRSGKRVVVSQVDTAGERFDLEYLDAAGAVVSYRAHLPRLTVRDLETLEGWSRRERD